MIGQRKVTVYGTKTRETSASDVEVVLPGRGLQYEGKITYLNTKGCLVATKCRLEPGTNVEIWMRTEGMPLRVMANLLERRATGVEFQFHPMPDRKMHQIEILQGELEDEAKAKAALTESA